MSLVPSARLFKGARGPNEPVSDPHTKTHGIPLQTVRNRRFLQKVQFPKPFSSNILRRFFVDWALYATKVDFQGRRVDAIRVRDEIPAGPPAPGPRPAPAPVTQADADRESGEIPY